jgi:signal transduction histidine kinase
VIFEANLSAATLLAIERGALFNQPFSRFIMNGDQDIYYLHRKALMEKAEPQTFELRMMKNNGKWFWGRIDAMRSTKEDLTVFRFAISDVSDRKLAEEQLLILERRILDQKIQQTQKLESLALLAGGIAHDYNNLLGIMLGNISLAQRYLPSNHPALKNIGKATAAMDRAEQLTKLILTYAGKGKFQSCPIDIGAVVQENVSMLKASMFKCISFVTRLPGDAVYMSGDPGQIQQVVMNLIINAGEAIGGENGVVTITLLPVSMTRDALAPYETLMKTVLAEGRYALLEIADNGIGMTPDALTKIFDPFYTTKRTGSGLGLSAARGIIAGCDGGITVDSTEGVGTRIRVLLPIMTVPAGTNSPANDMRATMTPMTLSVLIIDDEIEIASMAKEILESEHYSTLVEHDPVHAIEVYKEHRGEIGAVLLDLTMPVMSGKDVADALREIDPDVKIILSSGYTEDEVIKKIGDAHVSGFIHKPYRMTSLLSMVHTVVGSPGS